MDNLFRKSCASADKLLDILPVLFLNRLMIHLCMGSCDELGKCARAGSVDLLDKEASIHG